MGWAQQLLVSSVRLSGELTIETEDGFGNPTNLNGFQKWEWFYVDYAHSTFRASQQFPGNGIIEPKGRAASGWRLSTLQALPVWPEHEGTNI